MILIVCKVTVNIYVKLLSFREYIVIMLFVTAILISS